MEPSRPFSEDVWGTVEMSFERGLVENSVEMVPVGLVF